MGKLDKKLEEFGLMAIGNNEKADENFKTDNGSAAHISPYFQDFVEYTAFPEPKRLKGIGLGKASGFGRVRVRSEIKGKTFEFDLHDVLYVKTVPFRLIPVLAAEDKGCGLEILHSGRRQAHDRMYLVRRWQRGPLACAQAVDRVERYL